MYCVVETIEDNEKVCTAVPKTWIKNNKLLWPRTRKEYQTGRKNKIDPKDDWTKIPCKILIDNIGKSII